MIVKITIDTEHLGDTPKIQLDGHDIKVFHIDFDWTNFKDPLPSNSKLTIKRLSDHMYGHHTNEAVMQDITWKTALH